MEAQEDEDRSCNKLSSEAIPNGCLRGLEKPGCRYIVLEAHATIENQRHQDDLYNLKLSGVRYFPILYQCRCHHLASIPASGIRLPGTRSLDNHGLYHERRNL